MWQNRAGVYLLLLVFRGFALNQNPAFCAQDVTNAIDQLTSAANDLAETAVDCTVPTLDESSCAIDISRWLAHFSYLAFRISRATETCGNLDNGCAADIGAGIGVISDVVTGLIAASGDCINSPFLCLFDVFYVVDELSNFARLVVSQLKTCQRKGIAPAPAPTGSLLPLRGKRGPLKRIRVGSPAVQPLVLPDRFRSPADIYRRKRRLTGMQSPQTSADGHGKLELLV